MTKESEVVCITLGAGEKELKKKEREREEEPLICISHATHDFLKKKKKKKNNKKRKRKHQKPQPKLSTLHYARNTHRNNGASALASSSAMAAPANITVIAARAA